MKGCRPLNEAEITKLLDAMQGRWGARNRALLLLGVHTGFRISELLSIRLSDVVQEGELVDRLAIRRRHMKRKTEGRSVVLHPRARAALALWLEQLGVVHPETWVFQSGKGRGRNTRLTPRAFWKILQGACWDAGVTPRAVGTHSMRKTFAARMFELLGGRLELLQRALGHQSINSTVSYVASWQREIDDAVLAW